ncbi:MAG: hypothetical protein NT069_32235 [Planctomycetota bacterium]|nr:hypothetical protein [Planctomycetota bacterium]
MGAIKLRIFGGDEIGGGKSGTARSAWRLREAFDSLMAPHLATPGTRSVYATTLKKWEALTENPRLDSIDVDAVRTFSRELQRDVNGNTAAKYLRHLRAILRRCGPATDGNPLGAEILTRSPHVEMPKRRHTVPRVATVAEVDALFRACEHASWPRVAGVATMNLWRAAILCLWTLGPRCWDLWACRPRDRHGTGWRWDRVDMDAATITYDQKKTGHETKLPLSASCLRYLHLVQSDRFAIFPATQARGSLY